MDEYNGYFTYFMKIIFYIYKHNKELNLSHQFLVKGTLMIERAIRIKKPVLLIPTKNATPN